MKRTVVVGMSGGVDSSVSALLLKQQGWQVIGIFMKNWQDADPACTAAKDYDDVAWTCGKLDIPFMSFNFENEYRDQVFKDFIADLEQGFTPNPDILCNKYIKFKVFFDKAMAMGADCLATGHYCQTANGRLLKGLDPGKDQSYFLSAIDGRVLDRTLFPIGHLLKPEVRRIALEHGLPTHAKKDSTGICFIGERKFSRFLSDYLKATPGDFVTLAGERVGTHNGAAYYTRGQRKGLGLGGPGERWYVIDKDIAKNVVYVERGEHPALFTHNLIASAPTWIGPPPGDLTRLKAKIRYRQTDQDCTATLQLDGTLLVHFPVPQRAATAGQTIAFYSDDVCLGSSRIDSVL